MAIVGTLFINIKAKTGDFVKQIEGGLDRAKGAVAKYNAVLARLTERQQKASKGPPVSLTQKAMAAGLALIGTHSTRAAVRVAAFGVKAKAVFERMAQGLGVANGALKLFGLGLGVGVLVAVGAFFSRVVTMAVGRFVELRTKLREVSVQWRTFQLQAARAFAPLIGVVLDLISKNLRAWIDGGAAGFDGMAASAGFVVAAVMGIVAVVRTLWNLVTAVFRAILAGILQVIRPLAAVTDMLGITETAVLTLDGASLELFNGAAGDLEDIGAAWSGLFGDMNAAMSAGAKGTAGAGALTEGGMTGSEGAIDAWRRQEGLLREIRDAIKQGGPR